MTVPDRRLSSSAASIANSSTIGRASAFPAQATTELHAAALAPPRRIDDTGGHLFELEFPPENRLHRYGWSALKYLAQTEVHTYAFSFAPNAILSFFPFIVLLLTLTRTVFHSSLMYNVVLQLLRTYLPSNQDFVIRNLQFLASVHGRGQALSFVMLLITSTGIFLPLEVALNRIWGFEKNRSYLMNQVVALALTLACGTLILFSIALTAQNLKYLGFATGDQNLVLRGFAFIVLKGSAMVATIAMYFLIYWLLPRGRVPVRAVLPAAIVMGMASEAAKYLYIRALPWLNFQEVYGPFSVSVTLIFWSFLTGMMLLVGAYLSATQHSARIRARV